MLLSTIDTRVPEVQPDQTNLIIVFMYFTFFYLLLIFQSVRKTGWSNIRKIFKHKKYPKNVFGFIAIYSIICVMTGTSILIFSYSNNFIITKLLTILIGSYVLVLYGTVIIYPYLHRLGIVTGVGSGFKFKNYTKSHLKNVDLVALDRKLKLFITDGHIYKNEDLTLPKMAGDLELTQHQLSEYMNVILKTSFSEYIKKVRIDAAKTLLEKNLNQSVETIGFQVGFASASAFYAAFSAETGLTPAQYRKTLK